MTRAVLAGLICVVACGDNVVDKAAVCSFGTAQSASTVEDRRVIGLAAEYTPDLGLAARDTELAGSIAARRAAAWQIVERVLRPVPLGDPALAANFGGTQPVIPAWHTWYARDDFERVFKKLYRDLGPEGRAVRAPIDGEAGLQWNAVALDDDPAWPEQRYLDYLAAIDSPEKANGVGGASRVGYSPGAVKKLVESYGKEYACRTAPVDPARFESDPMREGHAVTETEGADVASCELRMLGPFLAGAGDVRVTTRGDGDVDLYVRRGSPPTTDRFDCRSSGDASDEECSVGGDGPIYVGVFGAEPGHVEVDVAYVTSDVKDPTCLDGEMPRDGVLVKADWRRQLPGELLPIYDTSGPRMASRLAGEAQWNSDGVGDPQVSEIYTTVVPSGARFRLPALHIMSKELDHWVWITLWYSPQPDTDFGADRPAAIAALPGPWRNYKMCVATTYVEADADPRGGQAGSLGDALAAVSGGAGAPTWCSNPYIELGAGNAATNCIGCHQHGGTALAPEKILSDEPHRGVTRTRNNFFTDYLWVVKGGGGDDLSSIVQAEVEFWDASDP
ncbi:MAG: PPC domain-containing protein [Kofleriaceae bacterium]